MASVESLQGSHCAWEACTNSATHVLYTKKKKKILFCDQHIPVVISVQTALGWENAKIAIYALRTHACDWEGCKIPATDMVLEIAGIYCNEHARKMANLT